jgi:hypothetical protein
MATIITVHGTGATGPEEGEAWWQKGSPFEKHIRELVESNNGNLEFKPLIWDGQNSETSRRNAAERLYEEVNQLETNEQRYCLIGHSHGGTVITTTLLLSGSERDRLPNLSRAITVATPFIRSTKSFWLFSRLGLIGKSALVTLSMFAVAYVGMLVGLLTEFFQQPSLREAWDTIWSSGLLLGEIPAWILGLSVPYGILQMINNRRFYMYRSKARKFAANKFGRRLVFLRHQNDEAINGLKHLTDLDLVIFPKHFAVGPLAFSSLFVPLFFFIVIAAISPLYSFRPIVPGRYFWQRFFEALMLPISWLRVPEDTSTHYYFALVLVGIFCTMGAVFAAALAFTYLVTVAARYTSSFLSTLLNSLTWKQIKRVGWGNDTMGETSVGADGACPWIESQWCPLSDDLAKEITEFSNRAASASVEKLRSLIGQLALKDREANAFIFSEYLTWDELIHCSYFNVARFRMFVAYAIAHSEGFRPTEAFKNHPDYNLVAGWYEEIKPKEAQSSV